MNGVRSSYTSEFVYGNIATQSVPSREQIEVQRKHKRHTVEQEEIKGLAMSAPLVVFFCNCNNGVFGYECKLFTHAVKHYSNKRQYLTVKKSD